MSEVRDFIDRAKSHGAFAFDTEHDPEISPHDKGFKLHGASFATEGIEFYTQDMGDISSIVKELFPTDVEAVAYNLKYDLKTLTAAGVINTYTFPKNPHDPMLQVNLLDENRKPNELGLKIVIYDQYGYVMRTFDEVIKSYGLESREFKEYATDDARWTFKLHTDLKKQLIEQNLWKLYTRILMRMTKVAADIEWCGIGWDIPEAKRLLRGFQVLRKDLENAIIGEIGPLNLASGDQIARRLFEELGYSTKGLGMTSSGKRVSTDAESMEKLARTYPICDKIVKYRTANKMISTYVEPLTRMALDDQYGRIHPTIWLTSATGRSRMEKPNFQNIPAWLDETFKHLSIRAAVVPPPGWKMLVFDLSQIELRLCGHICGDAKFLKAYRSWKCTACNSVGSEISQILHKCPKCGAAENEDILKNCPKCKSLHVPTIKDKITREVKGCPCCLEGKPYDDVKIKGFWHGEDLHQQTTDNVAALEGNRQYGKTANFALIYCASPMRMHYEYPAFSVDQWSEISEQYFETYKGVRIWHMREEHQMNTTGVCQSIFGRKRRIPRIEIKKHYKHALNQFINFGVQASASEYIELCMANIREHFIKEGIWMKDIFQSNFVHDECCYECRESCVDQIVPIIQSIMENSVAFQIPIRTGVKICKKNWGEAKS